MKKIVCRIDSDDNFEVDSVSRIVNLAGKKEYHYTFWEQMSQDKYRLGRFSNQAIDLLYISLMVYYADRTVLRKNENDKWTRAIKLYMPVLELNRWNESKCLLERMLSFLSGDKWSFEFRERELNEIEEQVFERMERVQEKAKPKMICMLSGGMDSFIGAIDLLSREKDVWFVGHYGGGKGVSEYQTFVKEKLINQFELSESLFYNFYAAPINPVGKMEDTTRTRSFLFFSHAIVLGSSLEYAIDLYIPENGLISLNVPLTSTRLGSSSTRTTHPYYMRLLQELITNLGINVTLKNPYRFKTKGEMIEDCLSPLFLNEHIWQTMSCSSPDWGRYVKESGTRHCGTCFPCVIRRASLKAAYEDDESDYRDEGFSGDKAKINLRTYKTGIRDYVRNEIHPVFNIQTSGPIEVDIDSYAAVYTRGMIELKKLLDQYNG